MLQKLVRNSGLGRWIEAAISIDSVRMYKPHQFCYALVEPVLGVPKEDMLFVSSNSCDVVGAKALGFNVAWIRRSGSGDPATVFGTLLGRAEELGHAPRPCRFGIDRSSEASLSDRLYPPFTLCDGKSSVDGAMVERIVIGNSPVIRRVLG
jgi:hypothetical protein